jgi:2-keto-3-deoxygluconate permease
MKIKQAIERVPGGLMVVPLLLGAAVNTVDQMHLAPIQAVLKSLGARAVDGKYSILDIGGFFSALFSPAAILTLIALFLFCAGSQMTLRVGGRALKKGLVITTAKYGMGLLVAALFALVCADPMDGILGLSVLVIIAAMTNSNGGMYVALTGEYGNKSDVGAVAVLSVNDGPLFTLLGLTFFGATGLLAEAHFPFIALLAVFLPIGIGMLFGNLDHEIQTFLAPGQTIMIPFFAFALGTTMDLSVFGRMDVLAGGLALGLMTTILTGLAGVLGLRISGERSQIAGMSEASTAGNAVATPKAIMLAALAAVEGGKWSAAQAGVFVDEAFVGRASAQISISTLSTALLCPLAVILWDRYQRSRGIDGRLEDDQPDAGASSGEGNGS